MRPNREIYHLLDLLFQTKDAFEEQEEYSLASVLDVQIDTLEYALGLPDTVTEEFVEGADEFGIQEDVDDYDVDENDDFEDQVAEVLNKLIRNGGGR